MLFAKVLLLLSVLAASEAFNIITPQNQQQIQGIIASLLTPEDKRRLLQAAFGHRNRDNLLRNEKPKVEEVTEKVEIAEKPDTAVRQGTPNPPPPSPNCARVSLPSRVVVEVCGCDNPLCPECPPC